MKKLIRNLMFGIFSEKDISRYLDPFRETLDSGAGFYLRLEGHKHKRMLELDLMYQDTDYAIALRGANVPILFEGTPIYDGRISLIGFNRIGNSLRVEQIQANKRAREFIPPKFERMMVGILKLLAKDNGFSRLRIQKAEDKRGEYGGFPPPNRTKEEFQRSMKMRYNVTAKRSGFKLDESIGDYVFLL